ncbi:MAG TPA: recombinase family protein, partial [Acidimicrobiia bacterium]|nr:recombinase family protein [Acidimicrobiia bacterium]
CFAVVELRSVAATLNLSTNAFKKEAKLMTRLINPVRRAAVYARVSTAEQATHGTSLRVQLEECRARAQTNGWVIAGEFVDEGVSGTTANRPALRALLEAARHHALDIVVVTKLDRFARSMRHLHALVAELCDAGVELVTVDGYFDTATSQGRLLRNILGSFAEFERDLIVDRNESGRRQVAIEGYWPGGVIPFGWRAERSNTVHTRLVIDSSEARALRLATSLIVDRGWTLGQVARHLNALGVTPPRTAEWSNTQLRQLLARLPLSGQWTFARHDRRTQHSRSVPVVVAVPPILTARRHEELRQALARSSTKRSAGDLQQFYLLSRGRLIGTCGGRFHGIWRADRGYRQYRCGNSVHDMVPRCSCRRVRADDVEDAVWAAVCDALYHAPLLLEPTSSSHAGPAAASALGAEDLNGRVRTLERALARITLDYARADLPARALRDATRVLQEELTCLRSRMRQAATWHDEQDQAALRHAQLVTLAGRARDTLPTATTQLKACVLALLDARATVVEWTDCATCNVAGKVSGGRGGRTCPACRGSRQVGTIAVEGVIGDGLHNAFARLPSRHNFRGSASAAMPREDRTNSWAVPFRLDVVSHQRQVDRA